MRSVSRTHLVFLIDSLIGVLRQTPQQAYFRWRCFFRKECGVMDYNTRRHRAEVPTYALASSVLRRRVVLDDPYYRLLPSKMWLATLRANLLPV
jgi:hypothetical protein